ncbi:Dynein assembly factor 5, axonemal [Eumeta japonica]|uniref:Dynein assembly factor 5, axonemal n=1 Tax=Eumeta variegata TaxID=151549 RepID=A0A4C1VAJ8_EUMVA|nr:Dynein assembly factor 5, axonemal [Eumeta japonica]
MLEFRGHRIIQWPGAIVLAGAAKCFELSITPMAEKLFDENAQVRMQVTLEVGNWMLNLRDRYSFWHRMIPLLLTSLSDVMADIRATATKLWDDVGLQFLEENEEDLKKRTDFLMDVPTHYPDIKRPNLGCRQLVQRNIGKIVPAIQREMDGWQADPRLRVSQLLCWLIVCAEEGSTQHAAAIITALLRGAKDDDERVVLEVKRASKLLGYFITPDIWWPLLEPEMDSWGALLVLANILKGSQAEHLQGKVLQNILKEIVDPDRCQTRKPKYQGNLLHVVEALMDLCGEACRPCARELFIISFTVYAMPADDKIAFMALSNLDKLRALEGCARTLTSLYSRHIGSVLSSITGDARTWTLLNAESCLLQCALLNAGSAMGDQLHLIAPLLNDCLGTRDVDPEVKLKMFTTLSTVMMNRQTNFISCEKDKLQVFLKIIIDDVIKPNLVWSPGRTAEAIRTAAVACLCAALQPPAAPVAASAERDNGAGDAPDQVKLFPDKETLEKFLDEMIPLLTGLVDDNAALTRQYALRTISHLAVLAEQMGCFTSERLHKLYYPVLKRLDDSSDKVRSLAVGCVRALFERRPLLYDTVTFGAHIDALYSAMLVHLDDSDDDFRKEMLDALLGLSDIDSKLLEKKVKANIHLYRNKAAFERLASHIAVLRI